MKKHRIYTLPVGTELTGTLLAGLIKQHADDRKRYAKLESYIDDDEPIMDRKSPNDLLTINNFAGYITKVNAGYLVGTPVEYQGKNGINIEKVVDAYKGQSISDIDSELSEDCSVFGRAFENVYVDEDSQLVSTRLDPSQTIVIYDNTVKHAKMYAINFVEVLDAKGETVKDNYTLTVWTPENEIGYTLVGETLTEDSKDKHHFKVVPVIEYANNRRLRGDFEPVITLIDAYNILQSDRVIDREKLVDAILAFYGVKMTDEDRQQLKESRTVSLPGDAKGEYIIKQIDEAGADVLRKTIAADIHKFSMTPDLSDENFAGNSSGVALLYKLLAFEQNIKVKERYFNKGLMERFMLYVTILELKSQASKLTKKDVEAIFKRSLPKNDYETSQMIANLDNIVDRELLVSQLSFVRDASETVKKAQKEAQERLKSTQGSFGTGLPNNNDDEEVES